MKIKQISPEIVRILMAEHQSATKEPVSEPKNVYQNTRMEQQIQEKPELKIAPKNQTKPEPVSTTKQVHEPEPARTQTHKSHKSKPEPRTTPKQVRKPEPRTTPKQVRKPEPVHAQTPKSKPEAVNVPQPSVNTSVATALPSAEKQVPTENNEQPRLIVYGKNKDPVLAEIVSALKLKLVYPKQAQMQGKTGTVIVSFLFHPNGSVTEVKIVKSNAAEILQRSAIKTVNEAQGSFPKISRKIRLVVPIIYQLR
ncbi:MAG: TonB family protein [Succinivibrionaceae bacterium]|nr:TonB family protein [Succinivibrionaceae bacterium]